MAKLSDLDLQEVTLAAYTISGEWVVKTHEAYSWRNIRESIPLVREKRRQIYCVRSKYYVVVDHIVYAPADHRRWFIRQLQKLPCYDTVEAAIAAVEILREST